VNSTPVQSSRQPRTVIPRSTALSHRLARLCILAAIVAALLLTAGCGRGHQATHEYVYVSVPQASLRDRVAAVYNHVVTVKNGERLDVLEHNKRFVRVRTAGGQEGWIEQRYLVTDDVYQGFEKLAKDAAAMPVQGHAITRASVNMHVTPGRESEHLFQMSDGQKVELLKRGIGEKTAAGVAPVQRAVAPARPAASKSKPALSKSSKAAAPASAATAGPAMEDWWLVRDPQHRVGWVLGRMLDLDVPLEIAQYAEGQRTVAAFVLNQVSDPDYEARKEANPDAASPGKPDARAEVKPEEKPAASPSETASAGPHLVPQYLVLMTEPRDGLPFDYDQVRVFTWNLRRHRYETAYRERNFVGVLPVTVGNEDFDREGKLPTFTLRTQDVSGQIQARKYKLNGPIVRRVLAPGEQPKASAHPARSKPAAKRSRPASKRRHR
jgi:SH3-like domain-containing protein